MVQLQKAVKALAAAPSVAGGEVFVLGGKGMVCPTVSSAFEATYDPLVEKTQPLEPQEASLEPAPKAERISFETIAPERAVEHEEAGRGTEGLAEMHQEEIGRALAGIQAAREAGMDWEDIRTKAVEEGSPIRALRDGAVEMEVGGKVITVPLPGGLAAQPITAAEEKTEEPEPVERKRWYESYRWFYSSENILVIAGLGAEQNERVWKRAKPGDMVVWADGPGALVTVIKPAKEQAVGEVTRKEAAEFAAALAQAWAATTNEMDVFMVRPEQIIKGPTKTLAVDGERNWYRSLPVRLAVGVKIDPEMGKARLVAGPLMAVRRHADYFVTLRAGMLQSYDLAVQVKNKLLAKCRPYDSGLIENVGVEEIQRILPAGGGQVVEGVL